MSNPLYIKLEEHLKQKYNLTYCHVIKVDDNRRNVFEVIVEPPLTPKSQFEIEESVLEYLGEDWEGIALTYSREYYESINDTIVLTNSDIISICKDVPFNDVEICMFPIDIIPKLLRAKKVLYRIYTDNPDIPYVSKILRSK